MSDINNVVHLVRWFLPFTASFIRNQIAYHQRFSPSIVYTQQKEGVFYDEIQAKAPTLTPLRSGFDHLLYRLTRQLSPSAKSRVEDFILQQQPKVLHVHYGVDCLVYADLIRKLNIPTCVSFYGYDCTSFPGRFFGLGKTLLRKKVFNNPAIRAVLAMTKQMNIELINLGCPEEKIIVHYYGTETKPFYNVPDIIDKEVVRFLIISGFHEKKGHCHLVDAFAEMSRSLDIKTELHIVGDGPMGNLIKDKIAETGLSSIYLRGPVRYGSAEHMAYLRDADVFVHPSIVSSNGDKEGIPGAIIEAMAAGLPVISTYHSGIPSIIQNENTGLLVKEKDTGALQMAMTRLAMDKAFRVKIARQGQTYAVENLDIIRKEIELEQIYDMISTKR
jgi:colanic acid/amylovoran biosynthesis glycosyltransferase